MSAWTALQRAIDYVVNKYGSLSEDAYHETDMRRLLMEVWEEDALLGIDTEVTHRNIEEMFEGAEISWGN